MNLIIISSCYKNKLRTWTKNWDIQFPIHLFYAGIYALRNPAQLCFFFIFWQLIEYYGFIYPNLIYGIKLWYSCANQNREFYSSKEISHNHFEINFKIVVLRCFQGIKITDFTLHVYLSLMFIVYQLTTWFRV